MTIDTVNLELTLEEAQLLRSLLGLHVCGKGHTRDLVQSVYDKVKPVTKRPRQLQCFCNQFNILYLEGYYV